MSEPPVDATIGDPRFVALHSLADDWAQNVLCGVDDGPCAFDVAVVDDLAPALAAAATATSAAIDAARPIVVAVDEPASRAVRWHAPCAAPCVRNAAIDQKAFKAAMAGFRLSAAVPGGGLVPAAGLAALTGPALDVALLGAPLCYALWNERKRRLVAAAPAAADSDAAGELLSSSSSVASDEALASRLAALYRRELRHSASVLGLHPKAAEAWEHRGWTVRTALRALRNANANATCDEDGDGRESPRTTSAASVVLPARALLRGEFAVCAAACARHPRNYPAWTHRAMVLRALLGLETSPTRRAALRASELRWCEAWLSSSVSGVSDASAVCHAAFLLFEVCGEGSGATEAAAENDGAVVLLAAWARLSARLLLLAAAQGHETLWLLRRAVVRAALRAARVAAPRARSGAVAWEVAGSSIGLGGWGPADELALAWEHAAFDIEPREAGAAALAACDGVRKNALFAARYGAWLCSELR